MVEILVTAVIILATLGIYCLVECLIESKMEEEEEKERLQRLLNEQMFLKADYFGAYCKMLREAAMNNERKEDK